MAVNSIKEFPKLIRKLYEVVRELEAIFPNRKFTLDGHLLGSIGEAIAAYYYGVVLTPHSTKGYDGNIGKTKVEVKATQTQKGGRIAFQVGETTPDKLLVFLIKKTGDCEEIYNGDYSPVESELGHCQKNGQRTISLSKLGKVTNRGKPIKRLQIFPDYESENCRVLDKGHCVSPK